MPRPNPAQADAEKFAPAENLANASKALMSADTARPSAAVTSSQTTAATDMTSTANPTNNVSISKPGITTKARVLSRPTDIPGPAFNPGAANLSNSAPVAEPDSVSTYTRNPTIVRDNWQALSIAGIKILLSHYAGRTSTWNGLDRHELEVLLDGHKAAAMRNNDGTPSVKREHSLLQDVSSMDIFTDDESDGGDVLVEVHQDRPAKCKCAA
ncbi:hypothetical protein BU23DRAFT_570636 [Bimuria novae-zelandiae CBS 107.79]|uniref:Uncharacterized protein n=1 Tax=Bimuria novae-zelandiae CBS 107.79 TaxID=1447943 RepID=A0A6A5VB03_9PLEO|nr:hypothetical protein BU23DRAFT_570636 [Bimuria novae-zelandiae CBS 107.79]